MVSEEDFHSFPKFYVYESYMSPLSDESFDEISSHLAN